MPVLFFTAIILSEVLCKDRANFDVLTVQNVPFPSSSSVAASLRAPYGKDIPEMTICYRHLVESINTGMFWTYVFMAVKQNATDDHNAHFWHNSTLS